MALNSSGAISLGGPISGESINLENAQPATAVVSLNDAAVRGLAGPAFATPATQIQMPTDFYGKSNVFAFTLAAGTNVNLRSAAISAGWPGSGAVQANINSGTVIQSNSTGAYALTVDGSWPGGITLINSGTIVGRGGTGGTGGGPISVQPTVGSGGGTAMLVSVPVTINNASGTISGGGGGGGGGGFGTVVRNFGGGGGGGGGGNGFGTGGAGGTPNGPYPAGGTGGTGGGLSGGAGGTGASGTPAGPGGAGGSNAGTGITGTSTGVQTGRSGGAGGNALSGNPLVTFPALGTIYGPRV